MPRATAAQRPFKRRQKRTGDPSLVGAAHANAAFVWGSALVVCLFIAVWWFHKHYALELRSPVTLHLQWPIVVTQRRAANTDESVLDLQGRVLSEWQRYVCQKFGPDCRLALAIQRAENATGQCEVYHHNSDGTLDWGYFQINTVHVQRSDLTLRDLLDCKANIDFAHKLYLEHGGFGPWTTFRNGKYRRFLR
jgi:hypothetical protein